MSFDTQWEQALAILARTAIWPSNYAPPALHLLWRLGLAIPPPHFARFWPTAAALGTAFAVAWGLMMWFFVWSRQSMSPFAALVAAAVAGALFGLSMATYYAYGRRKYQLPSWRSLEEGNART